jgi:hypothetical protein
LADFQLDIQATLVLLGAGTRVVAEHIHAAKVGGLTLFLPVPGKYVCRSCGAAAVLPRAQYIACFSDWNMLEKVAFDLLSSSRWAKWILLVSFG